MIGNALESIGHYFFGWPSVSVIVGIVALVIATLEPAIIAKIIPDLRRTMIAVAVIAFTFTAISGKYYNDGLSEKQRQWNAEIAQETVNGEKARANAVASVIAESPSSVRDDRFNRDNWRKPGNK
jgi:hypothetical protein